MDVLTEKKQVAIYARVATSTQIDSNFALERQILACKERCVSEGYTLEEKHIYQEIVSGAADYNTYAQLTVLRQAAEQHEFDKVYVFTFDRLSRNALYVAAIIGELKQNGVIVESVSEPALLLSPFYQLS